VARSEAGESVLSRAVRIFEAFTPDETTLGISEIARRAGLHQATASRLVAELERHGLLAREPGRRVRIGVRMWELALRASPALSLRETAMPFMADAHSAIGHHVQLGVLDGDEVIFVERLSAPHAVINYTRIAGRLPLHVSSSGLVLLAHAPAAFQERMLARPMAGYTPNTITEPRRLRTVLAEVRRQGFAYCPGYVHEDALGIAVPVRKGSAVVAALSAIVPVNASSRTVTGVLTASAREIGQSLAIPNGGA
jgi:DNA-binding IclR family transcriptional regulator